MRFIARAVLLGAAALLASPGTAQEPPPTDSASDIVVTGQRHREEVVRDFVKALTHTVGGTAIPRFIDQICPVAVGLGPAQSERVAERLRTIADAAGLKVASKGCAPNAFVIVTRNKREFIQTLAKERPTSFGEMTGRQIRSLAKSRGPAAAWQLTGPVDQSGTPLRFDEGLGTYVNSTTEAASRIRSSGGRGFDASVLVVEGRALEGLTATQLADYAAMRLLAKLDPSRLPTPAPPTILTVLETPMGGSVPVTMTKWDLGLLRGLYTSSASLSAASRRSQMTKEVNEALDSETP